MNALLVGCGRHALENIIPALNQTATIETLFLLDPCDLAVSTARAAARMKTARLANIRAASGRCDLVLVAVSPMVNHDVLSECSNDGVAVFVEKPPAISSRDWEQTLEQAAAHEIYVGLNYRFAPAIRVFREATDPSLYPYITIRYFSRHPFGPENGLPPMRAWVLGNLIHVCSLLLDWLGPPLRVCGFSSENPRGPVFLSVVFEYSGGRIVSLCAGNVTPRFDFSIVAHGVDGKTTSMRGCELVTERSRDKSSVANCDGETVLFRSDAAKFIRRGFLGQFSALCGSEADRRLVATAVHGLESLKLCEQILDACQRVD